MYISNFLITSVAVNPLTLNTLTTKSDWHQISLHNITPESHVKVMRIKNKWTPTKEALIGKQILLVSSLGNV